MSAFWGWLSDLAHAIPIPGIDHQQPGTFGHAKRPRSCPSGPMRQLSLHALLHDNLGEATWETQLRAELPTFDHRPGAAPAHVDVLVTNERDLIRTLSVKDSPVSSYHVAIQAAIADHKRQSAPHPVASSPGPAAMSRSLSQTSAHTRTPSSSSTAASTTASANERSGIRRPDTSIRCQTRVDDRPYELSALELEFKVFAHLDKHPMPHPGNPMPPADDDENRAAPAQDLGFAFSDVWKRGLSKSMIYIVIAHEICGTRLGALAIGEYMQRLAIVPFGDDQFAVAIEVTEQMAAAHPDLLHIVDLFATAPRKADMPWCFCDDDNNYKPNPEALHAWRELAYAAYRFISPISFTAPLERVPLDRSAPIPAALHADRSVVTPFMSNPTEQHALARVARPSLLANPPRTLPPLSPPQPRPRTRSFTRSHTHAHSASADSPNMKPWSRRETDKFLDRLSNTELEGFVRSLPHVPIVLVSPAVMTSVIASV
ncbi:uncharacterized protein EHS24_004601 [Apiotrichum porosum]|uniref:Uncharacterized protein n=1 Tax=Apiotrichum porosum TaxID=105984 RepID=A0A427Y5K6_9TREE|nr:uncharacterized protein EHS24_004601 [Apiotrichum porosum]RSH86354.1 hypothetical protein EHS24_004601 [Apiotrichum porosum]